MIPSKFNMAYIINEPDVVAEDFDGQFVILNLANGHYYSLEGCGGAIWQLLSSGHSPEQILQAIKQARPDLSNDSAVFLDMLIERGLIRPDETGRLDTTAVSVEGFERAPRLEVYDDLAELIYADPIHDVDEGAGWPKPLQ
jgi:coenzyme PQQ synthesis protein D (PqqD)